MTDEETHPIKDGHVPGETKVLVIGTFPPKKEYTDKKDGFFFYSSEKNQFWNRIDNIFPGQQGLKKTKSKNSGETFKQNRARKEDFSKSKGLGFIDIFTRIKRKKASTKDADLISIETIIQNGYLDTIVKREPIKRICCTYTLAYEKLKCGLGLVGYSVTQLTDKATANGEKLLISGHGKDFELVLLFPATRSGHKGKLKDDQYKKFLFH